MCIYFKAYLFGKLEVKLNDFIAGKLEDAIKRSYKGRGNVYPLGGNKGIDIPVWKPIDGWEKGEKAKLDDKVCSG